MKMNKLLLGLSTICMASVTGLTAFSLSQETSNVSFSEPSLTNASYTLDNWQYDGWCKNAGVQGQGACARVFMYHSVGEGKRNNVKLAILLYQRDEQSEVTEELAYSADPINNRPTLLSTGGFYKEQPYGWAYGQLAIYKVGFIIGNFTFEGDANDGGIEKTSLDNFEATSFTVITNLRYSEPYIEEAAGTYYGRDDYFIEDRPFTSEETIGDYQGNHPYTGIEIKSVSVTYSCSY